MSNAIKTFEVTSLDTSGVSDSDLTSKKGMLRNPGIYNLRVSEYELRVNPEHKDAAGKQWGQIILKCEDLDHGYRVIGFVSVPMESLVYTSARGPSNVKTQIFSNFIGSLTGTKPLVSELITQVAGIPELLSGNPTFRARVGYDGDFIKYLGTSESGEKELTISLKNGNHMLNSDGEELRFSDNDSASEYYQQIKGFKPKTSMTLTSFLLPERIKETK